MKIQHTLVMVLALALVGSCDSGDAGENTTGSPGSITTPGTDTTPDTNPARTTFYIQVESQPIGAQVWVNGELKNETTPAILELDKGFYDIAVTMEGYKDWESALDVTGDMELPVILEPDGIIEPPPEDGFDEIKATMEREWERYDGMSTGPPIVSVTVERREDEIFVVGLYPGDGGLPAELTEDGKIWLYYTDGFGEIEALIDLNAAEFSLTLRSSATNKVFQYRSL